MNWLMQWWEISGMEWHLYLSPFPSTVAIFWNEKVRRKWWWMDWWMVVGMMMRQPRPFHSNPLVDHSLSLSLFQSSNSTSSMLTLFSHNLPAILTSIFGTPHFSFVVHLEMIFRAEFNCAPAEQAPIPGWLVAQRMQPTNQPTNQAPIHTTPAYHQPTRPPDNFHILRP